MTLLAAEHPERVARARVHLSGRRRSASPSSKGSASFEDPWPDDDGWNKENIHFWRRDLGAYLEYFFGEAFPEPHSTKQVEDGIGWGLETDVETLAATVRTPPTLDDGRRSRAMCAAVRASRRWSSRAPTTGSSHVSQGIGLAAAIPGAASSCIDGGGHLSTPAIRSASTSCSATSSAAWRPTR